MCVAVCLCVCVRVLQQPLPHPSRPLLAIREQPHKGYESKLHSSLQKAFPGEDDGLGSNDGGAGLDFGGGGAMALGATASDFFPYVFFEFTPIPNT